MTLIATKTLTAPKSTSLAVGTFYFRVPYDRDAVDRTLITVPGPAKLTNGKFDPVDLYPGPWQVRREIRGGDAALTVWTKFVVPADPPASSSTPGALSVTVNGNTVLAWDLYSLIGNSVVYPLPAVGDAQAARDVAIQKAAEATARAADATAAAVRLDQALAGAPSEYDTFLEIANKIASNDTALGALNSAITAKYSLPGTGVPKTDLAASVRTSLDKADASVSKAVADAAYVRVWQPNTAYLAGDRVTNPSGEVVVAKANFTSGASYSAANWSRVATVVRQDYVALARTPDALISGAITRDANGAATAAPITWPDGTAGQYTATTVSTAFPGAVDAYTLTYGSPATVTYTQPAVTRDATSGAVTQAPAITVA